MLGRGEGSTAQSPDTGRKTQRAAVPPLSKGPGVLPVQAKGSWNPGGRPGLEQDRASDCRSWQSLADLCESDGAWSQMS